MEEPRARALLFVGQEQQEAAMWSGGPELPGSLRLPSPFPAASWTPRGLFPFFDNKMSPEKPLVLVLCCGGALGEGPGEGQGDPGSAGRGLSMQ